MSLVKTYTNTVSIVVFKGFISSRFLIVKNFLVDCMLKNARFTFN